MAPSLVRVPASLALAAAAWVAGWSLASGSGEGVADARGRRLAERSEVLSIGCSGDFMPNDEMMEMAFSRSDGYQSYFPDRLAAMIQAPDLFYANLESVLADCIDVSWEVVSEHCAQKVGAVFGFRKW